MIEIIKDPGHGNINENLARKVATETLGLIGRAGASLNVLFSGDDRIRKLNREFRDVDSATDVMAFPSGEEGNFMGDVIISVQTAKKHAEDLGHSLDYEIAVLLVHGILHLIGYTDYDEENRDEMFTTMDNILNNLTCLRTRGR
ncbi:MAG: rRNA maturation RNase YbeY [Candidatus Coatesbacteria bacterium]|nr:rRNA maturation RNase YbeY [Candidatus Coatesbacteria bacterium]